MYTPSSARVVELTASERPPKTTSEPRAPTSGTKESVCSIRGVGGAPSTTGCAHRGAAAAVSRHRSPKYSEHGITPTPQSRTRQPPETQSSPCAAAAAWSERGGIGGLGQQFDPRLRLRMVRMDGRELLGLLT